MEEVAIDLRVVVPCYNEEKYLEECLQSLVNQKTRYQWEVVCINDGSTDRTGEILESYTKYDNIKIIHQENKGFSGSRNRGMQKMDCRYYMFVDADDILAENAIEEMLQIAMEYDADMVEGDFKTFSDITEIMELKSDDTKTMNEIDQNQVSGYVWGKIIKSHLLQHVDFPEGYWYEDSIMGYLIAPRCHKVIKYDNTVYWYRQNAKGITANAGRNIKCIDTYWITELMMEEREKLNLPMDIKIYEKLLDQIALNYIRTNQMEEMVKTAIFFLTVELYRKYATGFSTSSKYYSILEKALHLEDYSLYQDGCKILWNKNVLGMK
ncbi:MAG: glycosyltransferase [Lachnospiraceae bacterium]|nr:glycosyltransferase [Lachnospiraceae bacterium]